MEKMQKKYKEEESRRLEQHRQREIEAENIKKMYLSQAKEEQLNRDV